MLPSINRVLEHDGTQYLVECEDLGSPTDAFELRISRKGEGSLLWRKQLSYKELLGEELPADRLALRLRERMARAVETASAAVVKGKIG